MKHSIEEVVVTHLGSVQLLAEFQSRLRPGALTHGLELNGTPEAAVSQNPEDHLIGETIELHVVNDLQEQSASLTAESLRLDSFLDHGPDRGEVLLFLGTLHRHVDHAVIVDLLLQRSGTLRGRTVRTTLLTHTLFTSTDCFQSVELGEVVSVLLLDGTRDTDGVVVTVQDGGSCLSTDTPVIINGHLFTVEGSADTKVSISLGSGNRSFGDNRSSLCRRHGSELRASLHLDHLEVHAPLQDAGHSCTSFGGSQSPALLVSVVLQDSRQFTHGGTRATGHLRGEPCDAMVVPASNGTEGLGKDQRLRGVCIKQSDGSSREAFLADDLSEAVLEPGTLGHSATATDSGSRLVAEETLEGTACLLGLGVHNAVVVDERATFNSGPGLSIGDGDLTVDQLDRGCFTFTGNTSHGHRGIEVVGHRLSGVTSELRLLAGTVLETSTGRAHDAVEHHTTGSTDGRLQGEVTGGHLHTEGFIL